MVQELYGLPARVDSFNWGYDPTTTPPGRLLPTPNAEGTT